MHDYKLVVCINAVRYANAAVVGVMMFFSCSPAPKPCAAKPPSTAKDMSRHKPSGKASQIQEDHPGWQMKAGTWRNKAPASFGQAGTQDAHSLLQAAFADSW
jgi:hypothetical protein